MIWALKRISLCGKTTSRGRQGSKLPLQAVLRDWRVPVATPLLARRQQSQTLYGDWWHCGIVQSATRLPQLRKICDWVGVVKTRREAPVDDVCLAANA